MRDDPDHALTRQAIPHGGVKGEHKMDVEALVAQARSRGDCWRTRLTGDADQFMTAIDEAISQGDKFSPMIVRETVASLGGESSADVRHHLQRRCACWL